MSSRLARARTHLNAIAHAPRAAGSEADTAARGYCAATLESLGYVVREQAFTYSQFPGRYATPLFGFLVAATLLGAAWLGAREQAAPAIGVLIGAALALGVAGTWLARRGVLDMPVLRGRGHNLVATRGGSPRAWLMAHTDSKSQPVPSGLRAAGVVLSIVAAVATISMTVLDLIRAEPGIPDWAWSVMAVFTGIATLPVMLSTVGNTSAGALDNASGIAAVLLAAEEAPAGVPLGVVITGAEELGLAGARAWVEGEGPQGIAVINCDGIDDAGMLTGMYTGHRAGRVLHALQEAASAAGVGYRSMRLIPGILVDSVALAEAGLEAATLSRGSLATLRRVHRPSDTLDRLSGTGIPEAARVLVAAAVSLDADRPRILKR